MSEVETSYIKYFRFYADRTSSVASCVLAQSVLVGDFLQSVFRDPTMQLIADSSLKCVVSRLLYTIILPR